MRTSAKRCPAAGSPPALHLPGSGDGHPLCTSPSAQESCRTFVTEIHSPPLLFGVSVVRLRRLRALRVGPASSLAVLVFRHSRREPHPLPSGWCRHALRSVLAPLLYLAIRSARGPSAQPQQRPAERAPPHLRSPAGPPGLALRIAEGGGAGGVACRQGGSGTALAAAIEGHALVCAAPSHKYRRTADL